MNVEATMTEEQFKTTCRAFFPGCLFRSPFSDSIHIGQWLQCSGSHIKGNTPIFAQIARLTNGRATLWHKDGHWAVATGSLEELAKALQQLRREYGNNYATCYL